MSAGVSDHQRNKGQGNTGNQPYGKPNSSKDHHAGEHEEVDSWRNQQQQPGHHQGYASSMGTDPYMSNYYGSFQYPNPSFGVNEAGGPWSTNGGDMTFLGGAAYSGMHESPAGGHYNVDGMFSGGNGGGGGFGNFGGQQQPGFGYGFHGNGDYNAWGPQPRKQHYDDYYRDGMYGEERGMKMIEQGMGGLGLSGNEKELKDFKELMNMQGGGGGQKKTTWASIASQPAKPQSISKKTKPGMPLPPMIPGAWESKNGVAKAPIAAPVQAPAWERPKVPPPVQQPPPPPQSMSSLANQNIPPSRGYQQQPPQMNYMPPQNHQPPPPAMQNSHSQNSSDYQKPSLPSNHSNGNHHPTTTVASAPSPPGPKYPDEMKMKDYNPSTFDLLAEGSRFFVIKSYSEDDIHRSIKYEIWCSTEHGNKRLDEAFRERQSKGPLYLFFSVNGSGHFCGMAEMISHVDYHASSSVWSQDKWKGQFKVKWIYVKDVPNSALRHIRLENNENKPVTNSRDTQEVPFEKGKQVLKILHSFHHTTSIFDDFIHYEKRQEEEEVRKVVVVAPPPPVPPVHNNMRGERGGRGGFNDRGGGFHGNNHHGPPPNHHHHPRDRDFGRDNPRDFRDHRGGGGDRGGRDGGGGGYMNPRNDHRMDNRDNYNPREDRDRDREPRDRENRDHRGGGRGGAPGGRPVPLRN